jgi:hypothetical protein
MENFKAQEDDSLKIILLKITDGIVLIGLFITLVTQ